ncbi:MAG: cell division protein BolA [Gammaproteobacteria bacterium]|nr:MAG: cell division protein BolA [Gammaproteobacteria bacterium]
MSDRILRIRERLDAALAPERLVIEDQSALHAGHAGARSGKGHYAVTVVSAAFAGKSLLERHRMVYGALSAMLETDIHALSIRALAPDEDDLSGRPADPSSTSTRP